jgi:hypothetical protein
VAGEVEVEIHETLTSTEDMEDPVAVETLV